MSWTLYGILGQDNKIYYGQTNNVKKRWKEHIKSKKGAVRDLLDEGLCFFMELENFKTKEEARLTEALVIETQPCVNRRGELIEVGIDRKEYGKLYRGYRDEVFNKKGKCPHCGKEMIDRNLNRHYERCKFINKN